MKILLVIGHNPKSKRAYNSELKISEFDFWSGYVESQVQAWHDMSGHAFRIVTRPTGKGYHAEMRHVHNLGLEWGADLSIEFHFNGAVRDTVTGHEVLHYRGSKGGERIARIMDKAFDENLKNRDRGLKPRGLNENGGYGLYVGRYPSILVEPFFNSQLPHYIEGGQYHDEMNDAFIQFFKELT